MREDVCVRELADVVSGWVGGWVDVAWLGAECRLQSAECERANIPFFAYLLPCLLCEAIHHRRETCTQRSCGDDARTR
jgi:hypothetical protein